MDKSLPLCADALSTCLAEACALGGALPASALTLAERRALGGHLFPGAPGLVVAVGEALRDHASAFPDLPQRGEDLLGRQRLALQLLRLRDALRELTARAEAAHLQVQAEAARDALAALRRVKDHPRPYGIDPAVSAARTLALVPAFFIVHHHLQAQEQRKQRGLRRRREERAATLTAAAHAPIAAAAAPMAAAHAPIASVHAQTAAGYAPAPIASSPATAPALVRPSATPIASSPATSSSALPRAPVLSSVRALRGSRQRRGGAPRPGPREAAAGGFAGIERALASALGAAGPAPLDAAPAQDLREAAQAGPAQILYREF